MNLKIKDIIKCTNGSLVVGNEDYECINFSRDTRIIKPGDTFIAIKGDTFDGNEFWKEAFDNGADTVIINNIDLLEKDIEKYSDKNIIQVYDTRKALKEIATAKRNLYKDLIVVGITGSVGKTSTKDIVASVLAQKYNTLKTEGNNNNEIGLPFTILNLRDHEAAVIEMGISHIGEMHELSDLVRPDVSLITNIQPAHQEFFKTPLITAQEKAHIFDYQNKMGTAVINADTLCAKELIHSAIKQNIRHVVKFGLDEEAQYHLQTLSIDLTGQSVVARLFGEEFPFHMRFMGEHYALDALAVLAVIDALAASVPKAIRTLEELSPVAGRGQAQEITLNGKKITLIDDAYNANPGSMVAAIKMLGLYAGKKIAVLGDMLELGEQALKNHLDLGPVLTQNGIQVVFVTGPLMKKMIETLPPTTFGVYMETVEELLEGLKDFVRDGDTVLVKSSHGTGLWRLVELLKGAK